jgi:hypothetical protein
MKKTALPLLLLVGIMTIFGSSLGNAATQPNTSMDLVDRLIQAEDLTQAGETGLLAFRRVVTSYWVLPVSLFPKGNCGNDGIGDLVSFLRNLPWYGPDQENWYSISGTAADRQLYVFKIRTLLKGKAVEMQETISANERQVTAFFHNLSDKNGLNNGAGTIEIRENGSLFRLEMTFSDLDIGKSRGSYRFDAELNGKKNATLTAALGSVEPGVIRVKGWYLHAGVRTEVDTSYPLIASTL